MILKSMIPVEKIEKLKEDIHVGLFCLHCRFRLHRISAWTCRNSQSLAPLWTWENISKAVWSEDVRTNVTTWNCDGLSLESGLRVWDCDCQGKHWHLHSGMKARRLCSWVQTGLEAEYNAFPVQVKGSDVTEEEQLRQLLWQRVRSCLCYTVRTTFVSDAVLWFLAQSAFIYCFHDRKSLSFSSRMCRSLCLTL